MMRLKFRSAEDATHGVNRRRKCSRAYNLLKLRGKTTECRGGPDTRSRRNVILIIIPRDQATEVCRIRTHEKDEGVDHVINTWQVTTRHISDIDTLSHIILVLRSMT